jgi:hypothetical protein
MIRREISRSFVLAHLQREVGEGEGGEGRGEGEGGQGRGGEGSLNPGRFSQPWAAFHSTGREKERMIPFGRGD